jgi:exopolysaccharide biosynthesis protein
VKKASQINRLRGFLFFSPLLIFLSCATLSPVDSAREKPVVFKTVDSVEPQWQSFAADIGYFHGKIAEPKIEFWVLRIDLASAQTRIVVKGGSSDGSRTLSAKVSGFVRNNELIAGINAVPFDISTSKEGVPIQNMGIVISSGEEIAPANPRYDALVFYKDGRVQIVKQSTILSTENIENAVGAFHHILINGEPAERTLNRETRYPRSAAGISANGDFLYLLVIDGRRSGSIGATEKETAMLLRLLGSENGINLDGGGSSALALRYSDGKVRVVNTPVHGRIPGRERAVAGCLGIGN